MRGVSAGGWLCGAHGRPNAPAPSPAPKLAVKASAAAVQNSRGGGIPGLRDAPRDLEVGFRTR